MTVNIYDDLNKLEATFRKTEEFMEVQQAVEEVKMDDDALALFKSFRKIQLSLQENRCKVKNRLLKNLSMLKRLHNLRSLDLLPNDI